MAKNKKRRKKLDATNNFNKISIIPKTIVEEKANLEEKDDLKSLQNNLDLLFDYLKNINETSTSKEEKLEQINEVKNLIKKQIEYINKKLKNNNSPKSCSYKRLIYNFETISKNLFYKMQLIKAHS